MSGLVAKSKQERQERFLAALQQTQGNVSQACSVVGVSRSIAYAWLHELGMLGAHRPTHNWHRYAEQDSSVQSLHTHDPNVSVLSVDNRCDKPDVSENHDSNVIADDLDFG